MNAPVPDDTGLDLDDGAWRTLTADAALASHRLIGWIFWDPVGVANYEALGVPDGLGYYVATRAAPIAAAGDDVVTAAFGSISPAFIELCLDLCRTHTTFEAATDARDRAVVAGLHAHAPEICEPLAAMAEPLWAAADALPLDGRPFFAAHLRHRREDEPLLSAWLAVNAIREWRGDTHWAIHNVDGIDGAMAMLLDAAWRGHDDDWLPRSRGAQDDELAAAMQRLVARGLAGGDGPNDVGVAHRQALEDRLDDRCAAGWRALGAGTTQRFIDLVAPHGATFLARIDETAGSRWMPAARDRPSR